MGIKNLYVDLSVFGPWQTGVALYSLEMAKFLANTFRCRIIVPQYHAHHFGESAILCPPPISFPGTGSWRHSGEVLKSIKSSESLLYCPHAFGTVLPINQILTIHDLIPYKYPTRHFFNRFYFQCSCYRSLHSIFMERHRIRAGLLFLIVYSLDPLTHIR